VRLETTLKRPVETAGIGLHSGAPVKIRLLPAPAGSGIVFVRTDLDGFRVPAAWRYVARVSYATSLMNKRRTDLDDRASAERLLQHGHRQCLRRN
jgi:UDP-3-O-[3-hydroxymyristoyl] N-acetylglucosamine deacetylase